MDRENPSNDLVENRRNKVQSLREQGIQPYPSAVPLTHSVQDILRQIPDPAAQPVATPQRFTTAGRLMAVNRFGKSAFVRFRDRTGQMQAYFRQDKIGETAYGLFKQLDIGDYIQLSGSLFQTRTGEWTLLTESFQLLCKSVRPLPEKFHGLKDPEKRFRQRYLDLIMNAEVREIFHRRSRIVQAVRDFFLQHDFLEVETPMMQPIPGGAEAAPFQTHHNALGMDLYLRIAPELYLKRLVVGGFERVFEINRNFRNEGISTQHNPEFTMLEFYQAHATYRDLMTLTEKLIAGVAETICGSTTIEYQGNRIELGGDWRRIALTEALTAIGGLDARLLNDREGLLAFAEAKNVQVTKTGRIGKIITKLFDALVEPRLIQPTFVVGYPVEVSPLSRRSDSDPALTDRFELFIAGREIANGFSELNDPDDQRDRFLQQVERRRAGDQEAHFMDEDYLEALEYGMPPTAGEGIGIDRLVMLLTDVPSIREVILFPHMKPVDKPVGPVSDDGTRS
jgi:lysyl-tRNA synthetase class 2